MRFLFEKLARWLIIGGLISTGEIALCTVALVLTLRFVTVALKYLYQSSDR